MRKSAFLLTLYLIISSCKEDPIELKHAEIVTEIGKISFSLPAKYDNFFSWIEYSDCNTCHIKKYRFQPRYIATKIDSLGIENPDETDVIDRFTICHMLDLPYNLNVDNIDEVTHEHYREIYANVKYGERLNFDSIYTWSNRQFSIFATQNIKNLSYNKIVAITFIKGNEFKFIFELQEKSIEDDFNLYLNKSLEVLKTVNVGNLKDN